MIPSTGSSFIVCLFFKIISVSQDLSGHVEADNKLIIPNFHNTNIHRLLGFVLSLTFAFLFVHRYPLFVNSQHFIPPPWGDGIKCWEKNVHKNWLDRRDLLSLRSELFLSLFCFSSSFLHLFFVCLFFFYSLLSSVVNWNRQNQFQFFCRFALNLALSITESGYRRFLSLSGWYKCAHA